MEQTCCRRAINPVSSSSSSSSSSVRHAVGRPVYSPEPGLHGIRHVARREVILWTPRVVEQFHLCGDVAREHGSKRVRILVTRTLPETPAELPLEHSGRSQRAACQACVNHRNHAEEGFDLRIYNCILTARVVPDTQYKNCASKSSITYTKVFSPTSRILSRSLSYSFVDVVNSYPGL